MTAALAGLVAGVLTFAVLATIAAWALGYSLRCAVGRHDPCAHSLPRWLPPTGGHNGLIWVEIACSRCSKPLGVSAEAIEQLNVAFAVIEAEPRVDR